ncbi:MAG: winged helix-turn-helix domain-containing protein [Candidatus Bathyarchaeia archaeon]
MPRRTRYDIYQDILEAVQRRGMSGITRISYGANMPVDRAKEAIELLIDRGLCTLQEYGGDEGYVITAKGGRFLKALKTVKQLLEIT